MIFFCVCVCVRVRARTPESFDRRLHSVPAFAFAFAFAAAALFDRHLLFFFPPFCRQRQHSVRPRRMLARLPVAIAAYCIGMLSPADHGALAQTSRLLGDIVLLPGAVTRSVAYRGGAEPRTRLLPAGMRRLPLYRLDVRDARITVEQLVNRRQRAGERSGPLGDGDGDDDEDRNAGELGSATAAPSGRAAIAISATTPTIPRDPRTEIAWTRTLRDLAVTAGQFIETRYHSRSATLDAIASGTATLYGDCLHRLERLETLRIGTSTPRHVDRSAYDCDVAASCIVRMISGVARNTLRRLELRGHTLRNFSPLSALPQLEVLLIDSVVDDVAAVLPWPMPNLRALAMPRNSPPPWPTYPVLEQVAGCGTVRLPATLAAHLTECATGGRLRWLSLTSYAWLPVRTTAHLVSALPSLAVVEVGASATIESARDPATWRLDARHLATQLAAWSGHKMSDVATADIRRWSASGPVVTVQSLLDF